MTSEGLGEMFEGDSADTHTGKFPLVSMGGRAEGLACADLVARIPMGASGILYSLLLWVNKTIYIKIIDIQILIYFIIIRKKHKSWL